MIALFNLDSIGRSPARFDYAKLESLNGLYMRQSDDHDLLKALKIILPEIGPARGLPGELSPELEAKFLAAMPGLKERAKTLIELLDSAFYLYATRPLQLDPKAVALLDDAARQRLPGLSAKLAAVNDWSPPPLEAAVRAYAEEAGLKLGQAAQPLRAALTGRAMSPGLFDVMAVLGREETLARLADQT
jgi:glutamyl-tRNA synthetase